MEYHGTNETAAFSSIEEKVRRNTRLVLEDVTTNKILPRQAAINLAQQRVKKAMGFRRYSLFSSAPEFL